MQQYRWIPQTCWAKEARESQVQKQANLIYGDRGQTSDLPWEQKKGEKRIPRVLVILFLQLSAGFIDLLGKNWSTGILYVLSYI